MRKLANLREGTRVALCVTSFGNDMLPATVTNRGGGIADVKWDNGMSLRSHIKDFNFERIVVQTTNPDTFVRIQRVADWDYDAVAGGAGANAGMVISYWYQVCRVDDGRVIQEQRVDDIDWTVNMYTEFDEFAPSKQAINIDEWWDDIPCGYGTYVDIWSCEVQA
jgi:hypothetical protein